MSAKPKGGANTTKSARRNPGRTGQGPTPGSWKPGQSGNPKGAPKRGESWADIFKRVGDMTGPEAAERSLMLAGQFLELGDGITLKEAVALSSFRSLIFDTTPGLLGQVMDRVEGRPGQALDIHMTTDERARAAGFDPAQLRERVRAALAILKNAQADEDPDPTQGPSPSSHSRRRNPRRSPTSDAWRASSR